MYFKNLSRDKVDNNIFGICNLEHRFFWAIIMKKRQRRSIIQQNPPHCSRLHSNQLYHQVERVI